METMLKGYTRYFKFKRKNHNGEVINELPKEMYFVIKKNDKENEELIKKTLNQGITFNAEDNYYYIELKPSDTEVLDYKTYFWYIDVIKNEDEKLRIGNGDIKMNSRKTSSKNEV